MTPVGSYIYFSSIDWNANVFFVGASENIDDTYVSNFCYVRPAINLKSDAIKYGAVTSSDPYRVTEN